MDRNPEHGEEPAHVNRMNRLIWTFGHAWKKWIERLCMINRSFKTGGSEHPVWEINFIFIGPEKQTLFYYKCMSIDKNKLSKNDI